jgi:hypothetical protein
MPEHTISSAQDDSRSPEEQTDEGGRSRSMRRWVLLALAAVFLAFLMREVLFPFENQPYMEISHGDHTHYVPKDRNETVPVSSFPMRPPESGERITPDGDIVSKNSADAGNDKP